MPMPDSDMSDQFTASIVSILNSWGKITGTGFLITENRVVTCAHVIVDALNIKKDISDIPDAEVRVVFPFANKGKNTIPQVNVRVIFWRHAERLSESECSQVLKYGTDIAVLKLLEDHLEESEPGRLVAQSDLWRHPFRSFGYPEDLDIGEFAWGIILGELPNGWVQIDGMTETGRFVSQGFSVTPVWDEDVSGILGMIVAAYEESQMRKAYFIPTTILIKVYPDLQQQVIPSCPYKGLYAFQEKDAPFFFGREQFTRELARTVRKNPFVAVTGPSGSGKSSLVLASLIPLLKTDKDWIIASFRLGRHPFDDLASALLPLLEDQRQMTEQELFVEDTIGNQATQYYSIHKVHIEMILKSHERMRIAIMPFEAISPDICDYACQEYLYNTLIKSFKDKARFNFVEKKMLEQLFSGDLIDMACKNGNRCDENTAQKIGAKTLAEGVICGAIQKWKDGYLRSHQKIS